VCDTVPAIGTSTDLIPRASATKRLRPSWQEGFPRSNFDQESAAHTRSQRKLILAHVERLAAAADQRAKRRSGLCRSAVKSTAVVHE
jgi:hypothetical protein